MKFSMLLFGLYQALRVGSIFNGPFKRHIKNVRVRIMFKTADNGLGRLIIFDKGKIHTMAGPRHDFDFAMVFKDASVGFSVLSSGKSDAVFDAAAEGKLHLEGMTAWALWFESAAGLLLPG